MSTYTDASLIVTPNAVKASKLYSLKGADLDVVRATTATYVGADGLIKTALANVPRLDYTNGSCPSILVEPQRTNLVLNSSMVGAVAGSPGTAPTGWVFNGGGGLTRTISLGTENGLPYIDFRFQGTATQTFVTILPTPSSTSASATQNWNFSLYAKLVSGTLPTQRLNILASGGTAQTQVITLTSSLQRFDTTFLNLPAGTTTVRPYLDSNALSIGTAYDFTIRIAAPQLEQGANATSYIPTTTASVTRNADLISKSVISDLIGQTEGTIYIDANITYTSIRGGIFLVIRNQANAANRLQIAFNNNANNNIAFNHAINGVSNVVSSNIVSTGNVKIALAYKSGQPTIMYLNGVSYSTAGNIGSFTATIDSMYYGVFDNAGSAPHDGLLGNAMIFKTRLTNTELQQLTTL